MPRGYKGGNVANFGACYLLPKFDINRLQNNPSDGYRRQLPLHSGAKVLLTFVNVIFYLAFIYELLFKMIFRYKIRSRTDSKARPPCAREGGVSV